MVPGTKVVGHHQHRTVGGTFFLALLPARMATHQFLGTRTVTFLRGGRLAACNLESVNES